MDHIRLLRSEILHSLKGPAWHGPALLETLHGLSAAEAAARPLPETHSIAEIALHCLAWIEEVARRLVESEMALPRRGDWPPPPAVLDEQGWTDIQLEIHRAWTVLDETLAGFPAERLQENVAGPEHDPPLGSGVSFAATLHGLAQHNAYHGGQIALLKRGLRADPTG
jgi:uncharacterized damage-inducible protein DinB